MTDHTQVVALSHGAHPNSHHRSIKVSTHAILFFGTPHSGANGVELAQWVGTLLSVYMYTSDSLLKDLIRDSHELEKIQKFYGSASKGIRTFFFYEEYPTPIIGGVAKLVSS
jgi:hypothetical protein